jgi:hypothetical protein
MQKIEAWKCKEPWLHKNDTIPFTIGLSYNYITILIHVTYSIYSTYILYTSLYACLCMYKISARAYQENHNVTMARTNFYSYQGRDYSFVDHVPEDLMCPICHELLDEPQQTQCGHLFCQKCLTKVNQTNRPFGGGISFTGSSTAPGWASQGHLGVKWED